MSVSESQRRRLYADLERMLGSDSAAVMMELMPPTGWDDVARQPYVDAQFVALRGEMAKLRAELKGDMAEVRGEMAELRAELKGEMAELRAELKGEMAELRAELKGEMAELRGEMAELRAEVGDLRVEIRGQGRSLAAINAVAVMASSVTTAGLVLAAFAIAH